MNDRASTIFFLVLIMAVWAYLIWRWRTDLHPEIHLHVPQRPRRVRRG